MPTAEKKLPVVVVITRLAIDPLSDVNRSLKLHDEPGRNERVKDIAWLSERLDLFSHTALPSVLSQQRMPDLWLIVIDQMWSDSLRNFEGLPGCAEFLPLAKGEDLAEAIRRRLWNLGDDILTIRLDSDDLISPNFVNEAARRSKPFRAINFVHGLQFWTADGTLAHYLLRSNPFVGFRSGTTRLNVHDFGQHRVVGETVRVVDVWKTSPMFLKISHESNHVYSRPGGIPVLLPRPALSRFARIPYPSARAFINYGVLARRYLQHLLNRYFPSIARSLVGVRKRFSNTELS
jgi:hypothetical protein